MLTHGDGPSIKQDLCEELPFLRRYARSLVGQGRSDRADDLVQDGVERALRKLDQFEPNTNMRAWLCAILRNVHIDGLRKLKRRGQSVAAEDAEAAMAQPAPQPSHLRLVRTLAATSELRPCDRDALVQAVFEGRCYIEIADRQGVAEGTVKSRISRARERLQAA